jgi:hypothetical protein
MFLTVMTEQYQRTSFEEINIDMYSSMLTDLETKHREKCNMLSAEYVQLVEQHNKNMAIIRQRLIYYNERHNGNMVVKTLGL